MSMAESQIINKILDTKDISIIVNNCLTEEFFPDCKDEFRFLSDYYSKYNSVPDKTTFLSNFQNFELFVVNESDSYLLDTLKEERIYNRMAAVISKAAELTQSNSYQGVEYLRAQLDLVQLDVGVSSTDIISDAEYRLSQYKQKCISDSNFYIKSGFNELDQHLHGWQRGEEFVVVMARTGIGKSWFLVASLEKAWEQGYNVGFISPEMTANSVGYRFDTVRGHFSNSALTFGKSLDGYENYIGDLKQYTNKFVVGTPKDFQNKITVPKLKVFCKVNHIDILGIDGISYLQDSRSNRGDNRTTELTHISEDLMQLSNELGIPVLAVVQSNRSAVGTQDAPDLESIRDSDGIAYNATRVIALRQTGGSTLEFRVRKNRYGLSGSKVCYTWDAEHGNFVYLPVEDDGIQQQQTQQTNKGDKVTVGTASFLTSEAGAVF